MKPPLILLLLVSAAPGADPPRGTCPIAANPVVELRGDIARVRIGRGAGMPRLEVKTASGTTSVLLGSMRYLMEQNFNPKAGQAVVVKGYQAGDEIVAIRVSLPAEKRELVLRDENGCPVWMGGRPRGRMRMMRAQPASPPS